MKKFISAFLTVVFLGLTMLISFTLIDANLNNRPPKIFDKLLYTIVSDSMEPTLGVGSVIVIEEVEKEDLKVGDIITFKVQDDRGRFYVNTHRIIEFNANDTYKTKGDNPKNGVDPEGVAYNDIIGRYSGFTIPLIGYPVLFLSQYPQVMYFIIIGLGILFIGLEIKSIVQSYLEEKREEIEKVKHEEENIRNKENDTEKEGK